jgi:hypothetical protein
MRPIGRSTRVTTTAVMALALAACAGDETLEAIDLEDEYGDDGKYEAWNTANNPAYVDNTFIYEVDQLPLSGKPTRMPWSGDYWATQRDNLNVRWDGADSKSPAEKIEQAFGLANFPKAITDNYGIYSNGTKACSTNADCTSEMDGSSCVAPRGLATTGNKGRCIPGWWGICHGWAPAAVAEPAPVKPVVRNGVTFYPGDLEGLMSLAYGEDLPVKFLSARCNKNEVRTDAAGRPLEGECRDMNPGSFHIVASNMLGIRGVAFVEDRTYDLEVWNQPVAGYTITNGEGGKLKEISLTEALALLGLDLNFTSVLAETTIAKDAKQEGVYTATAAGEVLFKLSGTGDADLHVKKGSTVSATEYDCRPYAGGSAEECKVTVAAGDKVAWMVLGYNDSSKVQLQVGAGGGASNYQYNSAAKRFFHVEMDFNYITESQPARESHIDVISNYTRTDHYSYILEADANGRIIGGEWLGESLKNHPDFVWWPKGTPTGTISGGLTYAQVKEMFNESAAPGSLPGPSTVTLFDNVTVTSASKYQTIGVPAGAKLTVKMTGTGNADLYVKLGRKPTVYNFDKASTGATSSETVTLTAPAAGGTYYVRVRPMASTSKVTVVATITP